MSDKEKRFVLKDIFKTIMKESKKDKTTQDKDNNNKKAELQKKTLEEIFSKDCPIPNLEESSFSFNFTGGPIHSEILAASAFLKESGEPIALSCKWYYLTSENEKIIEIDGVSGAYYQPGVDDIGKIIGLQATPLLVQKEATPESIYCKAGPLILDPEIEKKAFELSSLEKNCFHATIDHSTINKINSFEIPFNGLFEIEKEKIIIYKKENEENTNILEIAILDSNFPKIILNKKSNSLFDLLITEEKYIRFMAKNNTDRDLINLILNARSSKLELERKQDEFLKAEENKLEDLKRKEFHYLLEIDKLNKELYNQKKLNNNLAQKYEEIQAKCEEREKTISNLQLDMTNQSQDIEKLKCEKKEIELKLETYLTEKNFLLQELDIYQKEEVLKNEKENTFQQDIEKERASFENNLLQAKIKDLNEIIENTPNLRNEYQKDLEEKNKIINNLNQEKEDLNNQINSLKMMNKSILHEKLITVTAPSDSVPKDSVTIEYHLNETNKLNETITNLETTIETLKLNFPKLKSSKDKEKNKFKTPQCHRVEDYHNEKKYYKNHDQDIHFFQRLVSVLTETISDRDLALDAQKKVNKELMQKLELFNMRNPFILESKN